MHFCVQGETPSRCGVLTRDPPDRQSFHVNCLARAVPSPKYRYCEVLQSFVLGTEHIYTKPVRRHGSRDNWSALYQSALALPKAPVLQSSNEILYVLAATRTSITID